MASICSNINVIKMSRMFLGSLKTTSECLTANIDIKRTCIPCKSFNHHGNQYNVYLIINQWVNKGNLSKDLMFQQEDL